MYAHTEGTRLSPGEEGDPMFEYDVQAPLDLEELSPPQDRDSVIVRDIAYVSPRGGKVTAYLVVPAGNGPFAGLLFLHPGQWDRSGFLDEAIRCAQLGAVALSVDGPGKRPPTQDGPKRSSTCNVASTCSRPGPTSTQAASATWGTATGQPWAACWPASKSGSRPTC